MVDLKELVGDVKSPQFKPCYLIWGEEPYFIDEALSYFENKILSESEAEFNKTVLYGRDSKLDMILSTARRFPMMASQQVVIVKEAQELTEWRKKETSEQLEKYVENPVASTVLVFAFKNKKPDGRLSAVKKIKSLGGFIEYKKISERKLPDWIMSYTKSEASGEGDFTMGEQAAMMMSEYLGADLKKVTNAIEKMKILLPSGTEINKQHIEENVGISKDFNVFEFQKALSSKNVDKSYRVGDYFASNPKANPIQMVLPMLYSHFSKAMIYQSLGQGVNKFEAAKKVGASPYAMDDLSTTARNYSRTKLARIIGYLRESDQRSKGVENASIDTASIYKELIFKILH